MQTTLKKYHARSGILHRYLVYLLLVAGLLVVSLQCIAPRSFKQVQSPRAGHALQNRVCLVYSKNYQISLGGLEKLHPFDINKYSKIYLHFLTDGVITPEDVFVPESVTREQLLLVHSEQYLVDLTNSIKLASYLEFAPLAATPAAVSDATILQAFRYASGGTILAARLALKHGMAINLGGGYHHAEPDRGGGFCIYADMPIAIRVLQREKLIDRALIVDVDVHQGNGTARCIAEDDHVFTFDMHEEDIYPIPKEKNDLDVPLEAGMGDDEYLRILEKHLPDVFDRSRPDIVFLQAGVDSLAGDPLANLQLTMEGIIKRDAMVFKEAHRRHIPIVMVLGGGYSKQAWEVQYRSIRNLVETYGLEHGQRRGTARNPTAKEKVFTK